MKQKSKHIIATLNIILIYTIMINILYNFKQVTLNNDRHDFSLINNNLHLALYLDDSPTTILPTKDGSYLYDETKSFCTNGASIEWNYELWAPKILNVTEARTKCTIFFRKKIENYVVAEYSYNGSYQMLTIPYNGTYQIELWGAQGGNATSTTGGLGGKTSGQIYLNKGEIFYFYVGGTTTTASGGYNGGGTGGNMYEAKGGGGATDVRYFGTTTPSASNLTWNSTLGLNSRIMVAGAGGGADNFEVGSNGGYGGNLVAGNGGYYRVYGNYDYTVATGGGQTYGGAGAIGLYTSESGSFGIGGSANNAHGGGGGAGYYGGGAGSLNDSVVGSGAGGSSFISGHTGCNSITSASNRTHTNSAVHYSKKSFTNTSMNSGVNTGNGQAKVTLVLEHY